MKELWDKRYSGADYIYGKEPNLYFKKIIDGLVPGNLLVPGAGEGRDAVYAATLGWNVHAFDQSEKGKEKALSLAAEKNALISYNVLNAEDFVIEENKYDLISLIYFHLPSDLRQKFYKDIIKCLKPNGQIILEAFNPKQINNNSGGPKDLSILITSEMLIKDFEDLHSIELIEMETFLEEGDYHKGKADIIRYHGQWSNMR